MEQHSIEQSYLIFFKFLMQSKHQIIELGADYGLTGMQTMTLFLLDESRPMNSFKKIFNCDASNVTGIIDGLEQKELVSRYEDPADRRLKMVKLEANGRGIRNSLVHNLTAKDNPLLSRLTAQEQTVFISLLEKITLSTPQPDSPAAE